MDRKLYRLGRRNVHRFGLTLKILMGNGMAGQAGLTMPGAACWAGPASPAAAAPARLAPGAAAACRERLASWRPGWLVVVPAGGAWRRVRWLRGRSALITAAAAPARQFVMARKASGAEVNTSGRSRPHLGNAVRRGLVGERNHA